MTADPVHVLLAAASETANRRAARAEWVRATMAAWREAQRAMDRRCEAAVDRLSEDEFEALCKEEEAKIDAFRVPIMAVRDRDLWPRGYTGAGCKPEHRAQGRLCLAKASLRRRDVVPSAAAGWVA